MKKGQVSPVFKYVFGLIVGALFLLFFFGFAMQYKGTASSVEVRQIVYGFDDDLTAFSVTGDSSWEKRFPYSVSITFDNGQIISGDFAKSTSHIVFAPIEVSGNLMYIWTKRWSFPFDVDNLYYITGGQERYFLVFDDESMSFVSELVSDYDGIPDSFSASSVGLSALADSSQISTLAGDALSYNKIKFVFFSEDSQAILTAKTNIENKFTNAESLIVLPSEDYENGIVTFSDGEQVVYFGKPLLLGAIFAEDSASYRYGFDSALHKFNLVSQVYQGKASFLNGRTGGVCANEYGGIHSTLTSLESTIVPDSLNEISSYVETIDNIDDQNKALGGECPEVF